MKMQRKSQLNQIKEMESMLITLAEMYANETDEEQKKSLSKKIDDLHGDMVNRTRWVIKSFGGNLITEDLVVNSKTVGA